jgi:DNA repair exonuclease SbcCD nuclease subunit
MPPPEQPTATGHDQSRSAATVSDNNDHTLSIEEVSERYAKAGHPRTIRTLQRYCVSGHLDARKVATTLGDKYFVTPQSVARHIAQTEELRPLDTVAADRDQPRHIATAVAPEEPHPNHEATPATPNDTQRQVTTTNGDVSRYVERLEREVEQAKDERDFLREQIDRKDRTIDALIERDRETNFLVRGLQEMLSPLLGPARREPPPQHPNL